MQDKRLTAAQLVLASAISWLSSRTGHRPTGMETQPMQLKPLNPALTSSIARGRSWAVLIACAVLVLTATSAQLSAVDNPTYTIGRFGNLLVVTAPTPGERMPAAVANSTMTVQFEDTPIDDVAHLISKVTGVNAVVDPKLRAAGTTVCFSASDMRVGNIFNWLQETSGVYVEWSGQALFFGAAPIERPMTMRLHDVSDLVMKIPDFPGPDVGFEGEKVQWKLPVDRPDSRPTHDELISLLHDVIDARTNGR